MHQMTFTEDFHFIGTDLIPCSYLIALNFGDDTIDIIDIDKAKKKMTYKIFGQEIEKNNQEEILLSFSVVDSQNRNGTIKISLPKEEKKPANVDVSVQIGPVTTFYKTIFIKSLEQNT